MSTELMWKACELFAKTFQRFWNYPIQWNPVHRRLEYLSTFKSLRVWLGIEFGVILCTLFWPSVLNLRNIWLNTPEEEITFEQMSTSIIVGFTSSWHFPSVFLGFMMRKPFCTVFNTLIQAEATIRKGKGIQNYKT